MRFFHKEFTHIFKNHNLKLQGLQIKAFQQRYSKCKCETPYLEDIMKNQLKLMVSKKGGDQFHFG